MEYPETKWQRRRRLTPYLAKSSTCPTTDGKDLEVWEELVRDWLELFSKFPKGTIECDQSGRDEV